MNRITWKKNMTEALNEVKGGTRLPMIFFFGQECEGSKKMINEVLTDEKVAVAIERETAPMMVDVDKDRELARRFKVEWTPAFVICAHDGGRG
ncbi:MAG: thioredoxin family protein [Deltaproteobacteria bacterium]|nr:thioredoxin family protein [Deltaproteobacteria bacterium]